LTSALHQQIRRFIQRHDLCPPGTRLLVALSGGSDSVALTLLLCDLSRNARFAVVGLAHLNHQLRASAARDEQFCRELAVRLKLPIVVEAVDVGGYAAAQHLSIEDAARRVRYDFLGRAAGAVAADRIAVGHTQDDQAETFLLKLMRGAGPSGLGGIYPRRDAVIRPLLDVSRAELRAFLREGHESWMEDETNADERHPRNRVRHRVIPELDRTYGGATRPSIARAAALIREDAEWLERVSDSRLAALSVAVPGGLHLDAAALRSEPGPIRRRVLLAALREVAAERAVCLGHIDAMDAVLDGLAAAADLPGARVELRREKLVLIQRGLAPK
jgi:tRNA(Ile)-lysidine synthase